MPKGVRPNIPIISEAIEKQLLEDIERKGLPFQEISLVSLCDDKEFIYGAPSSDLRRAIQKYFQRLTRRTASNYHKLLLKYNIVPGPSTFHRLRQEEEDEIQSAAPDTIEEQSIEEEDPSIEESASESSDDNPFDIGRSFESLSIKKSPPALARKMFTTPPKTPSSRKGRVPPSLSSPGFASPIPAQGLDGTSITAGEEVEDDLAFALLDFQHQLGTKDRPFIIMADTDYPERSGPLFDITRLEEIECNNYEYQGFHIRISVDLPDFEKWESFIPNPKEYPSLLQLYGRIVMFKGPSMPFWLRSFKRYHENAKKIDCKVTRKVHEKTETAIKDERLFSYHLMVFKPGTVLDNSIFSNNNTNVKRNELSMKMAADDKANEFDTLIYGMALWWRIAEAGGELIRNADSKVNAKSLLVD
jgi:hypothetical protein